ncbi:MAG: DUF433 domain-containing protein [Chloroflexota bacterium]|nr:DUF433 domain-containing protein [Chloroflexota bacterium]
MNADEAERFDVRHRIVVAPTILVGKPVIKGTRIPASLILNLIAHGGSFAEIIEDYPILSIDDSRAAILDAEARLDREEVFSLAVRQ